MNKQITVPRTAGSFPIQISEGRYDVAFVVDVFDDGHEVAKVAVYHDGSNYLIKNRTASTRSFGATILG